jgi:hypothetical protein
MKQRTRMQSACGSEESDPHSLYPSRVASKCGKPQAELAGPVGVPPLSPAQ